MTLQVLNYRVSIIHRHLYCKITAHGLQPFSVGRFSPNTKRSALSAQPSPPDFHRPGTVLIQFLIRCDASTENGPGGAMPRLRLKDPPPALSLQLLLPACICITSLSPQPVIHLDICSSDSLTQSLTPPITRDSPLIHPQIVSFCYATEGVSEHKHHNSSIFLPELLHLQTAQTTRCFFFVAALGLEHCGTGVKRVTSCVARTCFVVRPPCGHLSIP